jgi:hypothetical protein
MAEESITITMSQLDTILEISKDVQQRVKANGMPELDEDLAEMITLLEDAKRNPPGEIIPESGFRNR